MKSKEGQTERGDEVALRPSLRDLRGSVPVDGPQDFAAIRERIGHDLACEAALAGTESVAHRNHELGRNDF